MRTELARAEEIAAMRVGEEHTRIEAKLGAVVPPESCRKSRRSRSCQLILWCAVPRTVPASMNTVRSSATVAQKHPMLTPLADNGPLYSEPNQPQALCDAFALSGFRASP